MFRHFIAILLLLAFGAQTFQKNFMVLDYYRNTVRYAATCENKAKPVLKCKGKCQLMKKIKQEEEKNSQNPERKLENKNEVISSRSFFTTAQSCFSRISVSFRFPYKTGKTQKHLATIFHPPSLV